MGTELVYGGRVKQDNSAMISNVRHISLMEQAKAQVEQAYPPSTWACQWTL